MARDISVTILVNGKWQMASDIIERLKASA